MTNDNTKSKPHIPKLEMDASKEGERGLHKAQIPVG